MRIDVDQTLAIPRRVLNDLHSRARWELIACVNLSYRAHFSLARTIESA